jgi:hypothetical protein
MVGDAVPEALVCCLGRRDDVRVVFGNGLTAGEQFGLVLPGYPGETVTSQQGVKPGAQVPPSESTKRA